MELFPPKQRMSRMKKVAILFAAMALTACGTIDNAVRSDESIQQKAAFALGTTPDKVTITNRTSELGTVRFNATTNDRMFQCYYTTVGVTSDVLCSPTDGGGPAAGAQCNALLKAAGKC
jgi:hypothetical protein